MLLYGAKESVISDLDWILAHSWDIPHILKNSVGGIPFLANVPLLAVGIYIPIYGFQAVTFLRKRGYLFEILIVVGCIFFIRTGEWVLTPKSSDIWGHQVLTE